MDTVHKILNLNEKKIVILVFLIALVLRLIVVINLSPKYQVLTADAADYDRFAMNMLSGKGFIDPASGLPTSSRTPLYPLFLSIVYAIFGHNYFSVRAVQCILGALLCVMIFYIGKAVFEKKVGTLSALFFACYPPYIFHSFFGGPVFLLSENLFAFILALFVLFVIKKLFVKTNFKNSLLSGVLIGLLVLTRPVFSLFPIFLAGLIFYKKRDLLWVIKQMFLVLAGFILIISPLVIRNAFLHKAFVPFSTEGGFVLYAGNNPSASGAGLTDTDFLFSTEEMAHFNKMTELEKDRMFYGKAKEFLFKNHKRMPKLICKKLLVFWDPYSTDYRKKGQITRRYNPWFSFVLMFSLLGVAISVKRKLNINSFFLLSLFVYFSIITMIFFGEPRFRYPLEPYLIIFASAGIFVIFNRFRNKFLSSAVICVVMLVNLLLFRYSDKTLNFTKTLLGLN